MGPGSKFGADFFTDRNGVRDLFEPIKDDIHPLKSTPNNPRIVTDLMRAVPDDRLEMMFNSKGPQPDFPLLKVAHNFIAKNSLSSQGLNPKGISKPDFEKAFSSEHFSGEDGSVNEMITQLTEFEFEMPNLRDLRKNVGKDPELFGMVTALAQPHTDPPSL